VKESGIDPVDRADVEVLTLDKETGCTFKATVTVKPEVTVGDYKGIAAEKTIYTVSDHDIDHELLHMRERNSRQITVDDRPAKNGDTAVIDFEGFVDDVAFPGGKGDGHRLTLGSGQFIPGFEEQIVGHNIGEEFDVNVSFPEEYHAAELAGKAAVFKVKLHELSATELPELDDEFAKDVSEFDTLDELKEDIKGKLQEQRDRKSGDDMENSLVDMIVAGLTAEIPEVMFASKIDDLVQDFEYRLSRQGMNLPLYLQYPGMEEESFRKGFREQAERQVKIRLALEKIAVLEGFEVSADDVTAELTKMVENSGNPNMDVEKLRAVVPEKDLILDIKCGRAIDLIRDSAVVTEKTGELEEHHHHDDDDEE
jgi:trigger factor